MSDISTAGIIFIGVQLFALNFIIGVPLIFLAYIRYMEWREDQQRKKMWRAATSIFIQTFSSILNMTLPVLISDDMSSWRFEDIETRLRTLASSLGTSSAPSTSTTPPSATATSTAGTFTAAAPPSTSYANTNPTMRFNLTDPIRRRQGSGQGGLTDLVNEAIMNGDFRLTTSISQPNPSNPSETIVRQTEHDAQGNTTTSERVVPSTATASTRAQNPLRRPVPAPSATAAASAAASVPSQNRTINSGNPADFLTNLLAASIIGGLGDPPYGSVAGSSTANGNGTPPTGATSSSGGGDDGGDAEDSF